MIDFYNLLCHSYFLFGIIAFSEVVAGFFKNIVADAESALVRFRPCLVLRARIRAYNFE